MRKVRMIMNWRYWVLFLLGSLAAILLMGECDSHGILVTIKVAGVVLVAVLAKLGKYWSSKGVIDELVEYVNDSDK